MRQTRSIDQHPKRNQIIDAILAGQSLRKVAKLAGVSHTAIADYKRKVVAPAVKNSAKSLVKNNVPAEVSEHIQECTELTHQAVAENPVISRVLEKMERYPRWLQAAENAADYRALSSLDGAETRTLELQAKLLGLLQDTAGTTTNVQILVLPPSTRPESPQSAQGQIGGGEVIDVEPG
jgi:transcriptional regulator with XRE-family HTH domain